VRTLQKSQSPLTDPVSSKNHSAQFVSPPAGKTQPKTPAQKNSRKDLTTRPQLSGQIAEENALKPVSPDTQAYR